MLSDVLDKSTYESILKESWTVTPYKVVSVKDFKLEDYLKQEFSFAMLSGVITEYNGKVSGILTYVEFFTYNIESKKMEIAKAMAKKKKGIDHEYQLLYGSRQPIARMMLYPNANLLKKIFYSKRDEINAAVFTEESFWDFKPGFLKNNFQKVNSLIKKGEAYVLFDEDKTDELKNLKNEVLYVPEYTVRSYERYKVRFDEVDQDDVKKLFKKYKYKYEVQNENEINKRILAGEKFYYMRYSLIDGQRYVQVVNSQSGEVIFRGYFLGYANNLAERCVSNLAEAIEEN